MYLVRRNTIRHALLVYGSLLNAENIVIDCTGLGEKYARTEVARGIINPG